MRGRPTPGKVLVAGSINTDLVVRVRHAPGAGETVTGVGFDIFGGGKGANQALAAVRSGARTAMLGGLGADDFGRQRLADLEREDVDCQSIALVEDAPSGVALIIVEETGENRIAYVPGATRSVTADQAVAAFRRFQPDAVLATLELPADALRALFDAASVAGVPVILNATPEPAEGRDLAAHANVLIVNESEAAELLRHAPGGQDWSSAAAELRDMGPKAVVITVGASGAIVHSGAVVQVPAPAVNVVDTTGAGDAFCGAFAARLAGRADPVEATRVGVIAGALAVTKAGAQPSMPAWEEIAAAMGSFDQG